MPAATAAAAAAAARGNRDGSLLPKQSASFSRPWLATRPNVRYGLAHPEGGSAKGKRQRARSYLSCHAPFVDVHHTSCFVHHSCLPAVKNVALRAWLMERGSPVSSRRARPGGPCLAIRNRRRIAPNLRQRGAFAREKKKTSGRLCSCGIDWGTGGIMEEKVMSSRL